MFNQTTKELEKSGLIERIIYPVVFPKVEYKLTETRKAVLLIVLDLAKWGIEINEKIHAN